ncbi:hypothetical protein pb186bvf_011747 [Paramecium bursaria]
MGLTQQKDQFDFDQDAIFDEKPVTLSNPPCKLNKPTLYFNSDKPNKTRIIIYSNQLDIYNQIQVMFGDRAFIQLIDEQSTYSQHSILKRHAKYEDKRRNSSIMSKSFNSPKYVTFEKREIRMKSSQN